MPNEAGTDTTRSDAPSVDDNLFGDVEVVDDKPEAPAEGGDADGKAEQDPKGSDDAAETETPQAEQDSSVSGEPEDAYASTENDLKVVLSIKGGRAVIGVQRPSADPHIETFDDLDETGLTQEIPAVIDRARARWEDSPKHPAYARPVPVRSRNRRGQGSAQTTTAEGEEAQQATLGLF